MKIHSLNNPAIEKDYQLLKLIAEQLIAIQPLIQQVACLSIIEEHGSHIIDHDGKLKIEEIISDVEQENAITINYTKSDLESITRSMRHYDNSDLYDSIEEEIRDVLL